MKALLEGVSIKWQAAAGKKTEQNQIASMYCFEFQISQKVAKSNA